MKYVKNQYQTRLTQGKLNACVALAMGTRTVDEFPFDAFAIH